MEKHSSLATTTTRRLRTGLNSSSRMEPSILDSGRAKIDMVKVNRFGRMVLVIKETGATIRPMVKAPSGMFTVINIKEAGSMIRLMDTERTHMQMELSIKDTGRTIYSTAMVSKSGPMVQSMRVTTCREGNTVTAHTHGRMGRSTQAIGSRTKFMAAAPTNG